MQRMNEFPASVEADRPLLYYETYDEYLDSLISTEDLRNLGSVVCARVIAGLGYRTNGDTLSEKEFFKRRAVIHAAVFPKTKATILSSHGVEINDPLNRELAVREYANRVGIMSTVVFVRNLTKGGFETSGYIDYSHRLIIDNWKSHFKYDKLLWPRESDLGYFHWRHGTVRSNITRNYIPIMDPMKGMIFQNRHDHKMLYPDPQGNPGQNTNKQRINSPRYLQIEIFDHIVRKKC